MKISIITYHNARNYGAILQSYALQSFLKEQEDVEDVDFIPYYPSYLEKRYNPFRLDYFKGFFINNPMKGMLSYIFCSTCLTLRNISFDRSIKHLLNQKGRFIKKSSDITGCCDLLVCGSDQIWNKGITGAYDKAFFGLGNYKAIKRKISYAASTELTNFSGSDSEELKDLLSNLDYISVREEGFKNMLSKIVNRPISVCIDPTLLCGASAFKKIARSKYKNRYVLVYAYDPNDPLIQSMIRTIPNNSTYDVHYLLLGQPTPKQAFDSKYHFYASVEEFLGLFQMADYVVTNSFHGLAFSLLFEKNFNITLVQGKQGRCVSLLESLQLTSRFYSSCECVNWDGVDYEIVNERLESLRKSSKEYLLRVIKEIR